MVADTPNMIAPHIRQRLPTSTQFTEVVRSVSAVVATNVANNPNAEATEAEILVGTDSDLY